MTYSTPFRSHNYIGEFASDAAALAFIQTNKWDTLENGLGIPKNDTIYYNSTIQSAKQYQNGIWQDISQNEIIITSDEELISNFSIINVGKTIRVMPGTYNCSLPLYPPPYSRIIWGYDAGDGSGKVTINFDTSVNYLLFSAAASSITTYDAVNSFTIANPTRLTISSGSFPTLESDTDWYVAIKTGLYRVASRDSTTQWTLSDGPVIGAAADNKPIAGSVPICYLFPSINVTMEGRLHITGGGTTNLPSAYFGTYGLDTRKLIFSADIRDINGVGTLFIVGMRAVRSHFGPMYISHQNKSRDTAASAATFFGFYIDRCSYCTFDLLQIDDIVITNNVAQNITFHCIGGTGNNKNIVNLIVDQVRGEGTGGTRILSGLRYDATMTGMSFAGSIDDLSGVAGWTVNKTVNAATDSDSTGLRIA